MSKLFEKIIYDQLFKHLDSNKLLYSGQYGFRQLHSVVACLLKCTYKCYLSIDRDKSTMTIFIYLAKAFDTIHH